MINNYKPIALARTNWKHFTSTLTPLLTSHDENYQILHHSKGGFCPMCNTTCQLQAIIATLHMPNSLQKNIYITYIDLKDAFGSIDHAWLQAIMLILGSSSYAIQHIGNICSHSSTSFQDVHFTKTPLNPISRGTIQGNTLRPNPLKTFLEALLWWLAHDSQGYKFNTSTTQLTTLAYVDDFKILTNDISHIQP